MAICICVLLVLSSPIAFATDQIDLSVGLKTLFLMNNKISGTVAVAVVFDPVNAESKTDAETIKNNIDSGNGIPNGLTLSAHLVSIHDLEKSPGAKVIFLAKDLSAVNFDAVNRTATATGALTMSTDLECVKTNKCILGIVSRPRVTIYFSETAANASHIGFAPAFLMLVQQI